MVNKDDRPQSAVSLWHQLLQCYKSIERNISSNLQSNYSQSLSRFDVLSQLDTSEEEWMSVGELTKRVLDTAGSISALLTRMVNEGLITRRLSPTDRRSFQVSLTGAGKTLYNKMASDYSTWVASALEDVSSEERAVLFKLLGRLKKSQSAQEN
jgi:MarR family transcriptional regulator, 2-MHQ and catechol-resistance regulon repressor